MDDIRPSPAAWAGTSPRERRRRQDADPLPYQVPLVEWLLLVPRRQDAFGDASITLRLVECERHPASLASKASVKYPDVTPDGLVKYSVNAGDPSDEHPGPILGLTGKCLQSIKNALRTGGTQRCP